MDGQPQACKCQCHTERDNPPGDPFCCPPIDNSPIEAPVDYTPPSQLHAVREPLAWIGGTSGWGTPDAMTDAARDRGLARLRFAVAWCGPWERLEAWLLGIDAGSLDLRRVIREHSLREAVAVWCGSRDLRWQRRHVERGTSPARRWARKAAR